MTATPRLYDTLERRLKDVQPSDHARFRFYCCGPTVYAPAHIGNFRTFVVQDVLRRVLETAGIQTMHVRNVTDVDDKTIQRSQQEGRSLREFTSFWLDRFRRDGASLNLLPPHVEPLATAHIEDQIALIEELVERGNAYVEPDGSVYFRIRSFPEYGCLSCLNQREITTHTHAAQSGDEYSAESLADFALWKARKPEDGPNFWPSPWGEGRPGWHIECSAMSLRYLGETFDLHSGGIDLIFPHHENEIAQSEASTGKPFALHWFHIAHLMVDGGKMSKSLGNLYTLDDIAQAGYTPMHLRYALLAGHYRKPLNFTFDSLNGARQALGKLARFDAELRAAAGLAPAAPVAAADLSAGPEAAAPFAEAWAALLDDLNVPKALGALFKSAHELLRQPISAAEALRAAQGLHALLFAFGFQLEPEAPSAEIPADVKALAEERLQAKQNRDWAAADALRARIQEAGWLVKDRKDGYDLSPIPH